MALPSHLRSSFTPGEINFLAESQTISVLPRFSFDAIQLIGTKVPQMRAMRRVDIPVWLAFILKNQDKCNIVVPDWMKADNLKKLYDLEIENPTKFSKLPWHWLEISKKILEHASNDMDDPPQQVRSLIQDLREVRLIKARKGIKELNESHMRLDNLSLMEINELRPFVIGVMNQLRKLNDTITQETNYEEEDMEYE